MVNERRLNEIEHRGQYLVKKYQAAAADGDLTREQVQRLEANIGALSETELAVLDRALETVLERINEDPPAAALLEITGGKEAVVAREFNTLLEGGTVGEFPFDLTWPATDLEKLRRVVEKIEAGVSANEAV